LKRLHLVLGPNGSGTTTLGRSFVAEELAVKRVAYRMRAGEHDVFWPLAAKAIAIADRSVVYDNSRNDGPAKVAEFFTGSPSGALTWPEWVPEPMHSGWDE
jgi:predicted ABC-type ATPase